MLPDQLSPQTSTSTALLSKTQRYFITALLAVGLVFLSMIVLRNIFRPATITVIGQGKLDFQPQEFSLIVSTVSSNRDSVLAINEAEAKTSVLIDTAKSVTGAEAEIKKAFYQVQAVPQPDGTASYQVVNAFSVKSNNVTAANQLVRTLYAEGATSVSNVTFSSSDKALTTQEARKLAMQNAHEEAKQIAKASGKRLGRIVSVTEDNQDASGNVSTVSSTADASEVSITKLVSVLYEMW